MTASTTTEYRNVTIKPADNVWVYQDGKPARVVPVRVRLLRIKAVIEGGDKSD